MRTARFTLALAALIALLAAAVALAGSVGRDQDSPLAAFFTNPDGSACQQPCLFGVRVGETRADRAMMLLKLHPLTRNLRALHREPDEFTLNGADVWLYAAIGDGDRITYMTISRISAANAERLPGASPELLAAFRTASPGAFLNRFGLPGSAAFTTQKVNLAPQTLAQLHYAEPHLRASYYTRANAGQPYLDISAELHEIEVFASDLELGEFGRRGHTWLGFTSAARYAALEPR